VKLTINGVVANVPADIQQATLLDYLHDFRGLTGTKFGCGIGLCGACTVHVGSVATRSCQVTVADVADSEVTTIEGLSQTVGGELHPLQKAWIAESVPQCGYCQAGQIMNAAALLLRNPDPTAAEIRKEMNGNLCRCGTYQRIQHAIGRAVREG